MDGEAIKIVIHDVDSAPICSSKRRVVLRRDPSDKAHRSKEKYYCGNYNSLFHYFLISFNFFPIFHSSDEFL